MWMLLWPLWVCLPESTCVCHLSACSHMMRVNYVTWTAGTAAAAAVSCWCLHCRTITTQQCIHGSSNDGTITWHWMPCSHPTSRLCGLAYRLHFKAVNIQVITHLSTHFHGKEQKIGRAEYLQIQASDYLQQLCSNIFLLCLLSCPSITMVCICCLVYFIV